MYKGADNMGGKISPSIMCADFIHLKDNIRILEQAGVEYLHFDIMDGSFVPNFTFGPDFISSVREITDIPFDIHLMVQRPENHIALFDLEPGDIVSVHQESTVHLQRAHDFIFTSMLSSSTRGSGTSFITSLSNASITAAFILKPPCRFIAL
jgi:ribulose-phosphate 3-epimerase